MSATQDTLLTAAEQMKSALFHINEAMMQDQRRIARENAPLREEIRLLNLRISELMLENESLKSTHRTVNLLTTLRR
jgi:hypothetical protein